MELGKSEARLLPKPVSNCADTVDGNADIQRLKSGCTSPRPEDLDFVVGKKR